MARRSSRLFAIGPRVLDFRRLTGLPPGSGVRMRGCFALEGASLSEPALETSIGRREMWSSKDMASLVGLIGSAVGARDMLVSYASSRTLQVWAASRGASVLQAPPGICDQVGRKDVGRRLMEELGLRVPRWCLSADESSLAAFLRDAGGRVVVQPLVGSNGVDVRLVTSPTGVQAGLLASEFLKGVVVNVHGLAFDGGACSLACSVQLAGLPQLTTGRFTYCGNDFGAVHALPSESVEEVRNGCEAIGRSLSRRGFRGLFGVDAIVSSDGQVRFLEVNPRMQGSTWLLSELQVIAGMEAAVVGHVRALLGERSFEGESIAFHGSQIIVRHPRPAPGLWPDLGPGGFCDADPAVTSRVPSGLPIAEGAVVARVASAKAGAAALLSRLTDDEVKPASAGAP